MLYSKGRKRTIGRVSQYPAAVLLACLASLGSVHAATLDLATLPLFAGSNVEPNIMVAVDDSGSMDFETLVATNNGLLNWNDSNKNFASGISASGEDNYNQSGNASYAYLFPNGYNNCTTSNGTTTCSYKDRRDYSAYLAVPPIPQLGFARDAEFNKAYFNPAVTYAPWVTMSQSTPTAAYYDPQVKGTKLDLTQNYESIATGETFDFRNGMTVPAGTRYYHQYTTTTTTNVNNVCYKSDADYYSANTLEVRYQFCYQRNGYTYYGSKGISMSTQTTGFAAETSDATATGSVAVGVSYLPATFYLKQSTALPAAYGWSSSATRIVGKGPYGEALYGYEIRPANFTSTAAYTAAINNFANWFTYYRKRHLAVRGGIAAAFDQISHVRVGSCTINTRNALTMKDLDNASDRASFYSSIFGIDFSQGLGTPNRKGVQFLGQQLQTNTGIITSPCQQNFAILFTDGYNGDTDLSTVGNVDGTNFAPNTSGAPFNDSYSDTMADVAMQYYKNLRSSASSTSAVGKQTANQIQPPSGCAASTPDPSLDCQKDLHMVTFGVVLDQEGVVFGNPSYPTQNDDPYKNPPSWTDPTTGTYGSEQIDDLWHATINTRGALLNANTPGEIASKFTAALGQIVNNSGSGSGVASNSSSLSTGNVAYEASFVGGVWTGELAAYPITEAGVGTKANWKASTVLTAQTLASRQIVTNLSSAAPTTSPSAFTYAALQSNTALKSALTSDQVDYIRGDRSKEQSNGGGFRNRNADILGDIVHSTPLYVAAPNDFSYPAPSGWQDLRNPSASVPEKAAGAYGDFASSYASRTPMVYVGANDGMLHGLRASDGTDLIDYVPNTVIANLSQLTSPTYAHRYYVDGSPAEGDVVYGNAWHTVLVGGLANGGNSIYALDITNPDNFSQSSPASTVLWEFTDPELGQTYGTPSIVRLHNGQWAAMVANGYNSKSQGASLYLLDIQTGKLIARIDTGATPAGKCTSNGLSSPFPVDLDGDFVTDYAYAGDLCGNLWKFDLTSSTPGSWTATKLFTAVDSSGGIQPITVQPQVRVHPYGKNYGEMIYFGTGKYIENSDATFNTSAKNSFYGIWDLNVFTFNEANGGQPLFAPDIVANIPRSRLQAKTISTPTSTTRAVTNSGTTADNTVAYQQSSSDTSGKRGWYIDFPGGTGELVATDARLVGSLVTFTTTIPSSLACLAGGGGYFMAVSATTGGSTSLAAIDINSDGLFNDADRTSVNGTLISFAGIAITSGSPTNSTVLSTENGGKAEATTMTSNATTDVHDLNPGTSYGRQSWREIRR